MDVCSVKVLYLSVICLSVRAAGGGGAVWEVVGDIGRWGYSPLSRVLSSGFSTIYPLYPEHMYGLIAELKAL